MIMGNCHLLVFEKSPQTQLHRELGQERAAGFYQRLREASLAEVSRSVLPTSFFPESDQSQGERYLNALRDHHRSHPEHDCLLLDLELLLLRARVLEEAQEQLERMPCALGPTLNGGYYLLGFTAAALQQLEARDYPVFSNIPWNSPAVMAETLKRLRALGFPFAALPILRCYHTLEEVRTCPGARGFLP